MARTPAAAPSDNQPLFSSPCDDQSTRPTTTSTTTGWSTKSVGPAGGRRPRGENATFDYRSSFEALEATPAGPPAAAARHLTNPNAPPTGGHAGRHRRRPGCTWTSRRSTLDVCRWTPGPVQVDGGCRRRDELIHVRARAPARPTVAPPRPMTWDQATIRRPCRTRRRADGADSYLFTINQPPTDRSTDGLRHLQRWQRRRLRDVQLD